MNVTDTGSSKAVLSVTADFYSVKLSEQTEV